MMLMLSGAMKLFGVPSIGGEEAVKT